LIGEKVETETKKTSGRKGTSTEEEGKKKKGRK